MKFSHEQLRDLIETKGDLQSAGKWRWGTIECYVFPFEGKWYEASICSHVTDGWQIRGFLECPEVTRVERTTYEWVPVSST